MRTHMHSYASSLSPPMLIFVDLLQSLPNKTITQESCGREAILVYQLNVLPHNIVPTTLCAIQKHPRIPQATPIVVSFAHHPKIHPVLFWT